MEAKAMEIESKYAELGLAVEEQHTEFTKLCEKVAVEINAQLAQMFAEAQAEELASNDIESYGGSSSDGSTSGKIVQMYEENVD